MKILIAGSHSIGDTFCTDAMHGLLAEVDACLVIRNQHCIMPTIITEDARARGLRVVEVTWADPRPYEDT